MPTKKKWSVIDLFSGGGGMSFGFHAHPKFQIVGAADAQLGKPSSGKGSLDCNGTYELNMGVRPVEVDLSEISPAALRKKMSNQRPTVLIACAPCTGFSRAQASNHMADDPRNSLVAKVGEFVAEFKPEVFLMENARELIRGNFTHHYQALCQRLTEQGYKVTAENHFLNEFGLPQRRERALVIACKMNYSLRTLSQLWQGYAASKEATTVRHALSIFPKVLAGKVHPSDPHHASPSFGETNTKRLRAVPRNGGSWLDLKDHKNADELLTPAMKRYISMGKFGSHPDVYGRMCWDKPAPTIKRECGHSGNGRYSHPEQNRLCTVRELAYLQGFPTTFRFAETSLGNMYRHIGDAVPPLISYQLAGVVDWILSGKRPDLDDLVLPDTSFDASHIEAIDHQTLFEAIV